MTFDRNLLDINCCPVTHLPLELVPESTLSRLNALIDKGVLRSCDDSRVDLPLRQALMTRDGRLAYPVRDGIPILLEEQGILLAQANES
jgi:uncharacterized protein YbaR (Trm112 family)